MEKDTQKRPPDLIPTAATAREFLAQDATIFPVVSFLVSQPGSDCLKRTASLSATPKEEYEEALAFAAAYQQHIATPATAASSDGGYAQDTLKLSLSVHLLAPRIQSFYTYYAQTVVPAVTLDNPAFQDCPVWIHWNGAQFCDLPAFQASFKPR